MGSFLFQTISQLYSSKYSTVIGLDYIYSKGVQGLLIYQDPIALFVKENWHMKLMTFACKNKITTVRLIVKWSLKYSSHSSTFTVPWAMNSVISPICWGSTNSSSNDFHPPQLVTPQLNAIVLVVEAPHTTVLNIYKDDVHNFSNLVWMHRCHCDSKHICNFLNTTNFTFVLHIFLFGGVIISF